MRDANETGVSSTHEDARETSVVSDMRPAVDRNTKAIIAARAALELRDGDIVNLGVGIPTLVVNYLPEGREVFMHTENGLLGVGPTPSPDDVDADLINASKLPVTQTVGCSFFASDESFAMIRGGHIDVTILGALQVDGRGRVANWSVPGKPILGVGGAMDLLVGAKRVIVTMSHTDRDGNPKILEECALPLTADRAVDMVITELAVFQVEPPGLVLTELLSGATLEDVTAKTAAPFEVRLDARALRQSC